MAREVKYDVDTGALVRELRQRHHLSQATLARRAGTTQRQISRIERGETSPSARTLSRLLSAVGERLELRAVPAPHGNQSVAELQQDLVDMSPGQRVSAAASLSRTLTAIAAARRR